MIMIVFILLNNTSYDTPAQRAPSPHQKRNPSPQRANRSVRMSGEHRRQVRVRVDRLLIQSSGQVLDDPKFSFEPGEVFPSRLFLFQKQLRGREPESPGSQLLLLHGASRRRRRAPRRAARRTPRYSRRRAPRPWPRRSPPPPRRRRRGG